MNSWQSCPRCGAPVPATAGWCGTCGLQRGAPAIAPYRPPVSDPRSRQVVALSIVLVIVLAGAFLLARGNGRAPVQPVGPTAPPLVCSLEYDYGDNGDRTVVIVRGIEAWAQCSRLVSALPAGNWQLITGEASVNYRICEGTVGSASIEVWDTRFSVPPAWTNEICTRIAAGTL